MNEETTLNNVAWINGKEYVIDDATPTTTGLVITMPVTDELSYLSLDTLKVKFTTNAVKTGTSDGTEYGIYDVGEKLSITLTDDNKIVISYFINIRDERMDALEASQEEQDELIAEALFGGDEDESN